MEYQGKKIPGIDSITTVTAQGASGWIHTQRFLYFYYFLYVYSKVNIQKVLVCAVFIAFLESVAILFSNLGCPKYNVFPIGHQKHHIKQVYKNVKKQTPPKTQLATL